METGALLAARWAGAALSPVLDCDETFNFWEPVHLLLFGRGLQTWEHDPQFALRTYAYAGAHAAAALPGVTMLQGLAAAAQGPPFPEENKVELFLLLRGALGALCALGEAAFVAGVRHRFGNEVARHTFFFLLFNAGMFHAGVSLLPTSTCMLAVLFAYAAWLRERHLTGLAIGAFAVLVCWPFCALMFVPMGLDALRVRGFLPVLGCGLAALALFAGVPAAVDTFFYGKPTMAILNLVLYNALGQGGGGQGADLYGSEPWHFYFQNLALNLNAVAALGLVAPLAVLACWPVFAGRAEAAKQLPSRWLALTYLSGGAATLALFTSMSHKEERFLSMLYPILALGAALSMRLCLGAVDVVLPSSWRAPRALIGGIAGLCVAASCILSMSRAAALHVNFYAPMPVYEKLHELVEEKGVPVHSVCVGKEWYRFPSSFFLPAHAEIRWVQSAFDGQLPQPFASPAPNGTRMTHTHFNDRNTIDASSLSDVAKCEYAVDIDLGEDWGAIGEWDMNWDRVACVPFMDVSRSPAGTRSFWVPFYSAKRNVYVDYCLLRRRVV